MSESTRSLRGNRVALFPWGDRFEDFYNKIGVSLEEFRDHYGGTWLFNLVNALQSQGVDTTLFFVSAHVSSPRRFVHRASGAPVCVLPAPRLHLKVRNFQHRFCPCSKLLSSVSSYAASPPRVLARELRRERCSAILCQEYEDARFDVCVMLGRLMRLPTFATFQGSNHPASRIELPFRRLSLAACSGLIIGAQTEIQRVISTYGIKQRKLAHLPNAVDVDEWRPGDRSAARRDLGISDRARVVAWHGRVQIERKGLDLLLDAWERLLRQHTGEELLLLLVGSGRNKEELRRRIAASSSPDSIHFVDEYIHETARLCRYLVASNVYVLPSRDEGFPVSVLEAMACGLPVAAFDVSGISDILSGGESSGGVAVRRNDPAALAAATGRLVDDEALASSLGRRARQRAEAHFSIPVVGERLARFMFSRQRLGSAG